MRREEVGCYEMLCGVDVGKDAHCCRAVARDGETVLLARTVGQDEGEISAFLSELSSIGRALVVVDQHGGFGALVVTLALLYAAYTYLRCYAAMAVGQSFGSRKLLLSVVFYIAFGIAESILTTVIVRPLLNTDTLGKLFTADVEPFNAVLSALGAFNGFYLVLCVIYFVVTYLFFRRKLNLQ